MFLKGEERIPKEDRESDARGSAYYRSCITYREPADREKYEKYLKERIDAAVERGETKLYPVSGLDEVPALLKKIDIGDWSTSPSVHEKDGKIIVCCSNTHTMCNLMMLGWRLVCAAQVLDTVAGTDEIEEV